MKSLGNTEEQAEMFAFRIQVTLLDQYASQKYLYRIKTNIKQ